VPRRVLSSRSGPRSAEAALRHLAVRVATTGSTATEPVTVSTVAKIAKVIAYVDLDSDDASRAQGPQFRGSWTGQPEQSSYGMNVSLAAQLDDRREIAGGGFGFGGPRYGIGAIWHRYRGPALHEDPAEHQRLLDETYHVGMDDVQDAVNQMLGRDPELHRPPRLSWAGLQRALDDQGIRASEQQLIDTPLEIVLSESAAAEVDAGQPGSETAGTG
jgi:hypothetical protein